MPEKNEIYFISKENENFPEELIQTPWPPKGIYVSGKLDKTRPRVAVVGTRRSTSYGRDMAFKIAETLSENGVTVVSGLALGIDAAAHAGAISGKTPTWAVLGSGLSNVYPRTNLTLSKNIIKEGGALISEYPPEAEAREWTFPERNRIIAGLSQLTVVIEAPEKSGALITARLALEAGREVAVVPGEVGRPAGAGSNRLLREGAHPLISPEDALFLIGKIPGETKRKFDKLDEIEESILQCLNEDKNADEIILETKLPASVVSTKLMELELKNMVKQNAGGWRKIM